MSKSVLSDKEKRKKDGLSISSMKMLYHLVCHECGKIGGKL